MGLFDDLPSHPVPLPKSALQMLTSLPDWPVVKEVSSADRDDMLTLERAGLIHVYREKMDPTATFRTPFAGRLSAIQPVGGE